MLVDIAARLRLERVATGHYARLVGEPPRLARGLDETKDQSYVLAEVAPRSLEDLVFPLGEMRKSAVRRMAGCGLPATNKVASPGGGFVAFSASTSTIESFPPPMGTATPSPGAS